MHQHDHDVFRRWCGFWYSLRVVHIPGEESEGVGDEAAETNSWVEGYILI